MIRGAVLKTEIRMTSRAEFLSRYPHPFLLRELAVIDPGAMAFATSIGSSTPTPDLQTTGSYPMLAASAGPPSDRSGWPSTPKSGAPVSSSTKMSTRLQLYADRYELVPVQKRGQSPWQDRILIGRALNNDIILRDPSVSKSHAHLAQESDGTWFIHAKKSVNGTFVDGRFIDAGSTGLLRGGSSLQFGNVFCEFIEGGALYDLFSR
jgi:hypothetical protein